MALSCFRRHFDCKLFLVSDDEDEEFRRWRLKPMPDSKTIPDEEGLWIVSAIPSEPRPGEKYYLAVRREKALIS